MNTQIKFYCGTFTYYINSNTFEIENNDNFIRLSSLNDNRNWYICSNRNIEIFSCTCREVYSNRSYLTIEIIKNDNWVVVYTKEERIKILAEELLFHKRRKQLTKIVRAYKERRKQKILAEMEKYMPIDLCKIVESYVQKMDPIDCRFNKN